MTALSHPRCGCGGAPELHGPLAGHVGLFWIGYRRCCTHTIGYDTEQRAWEAWDRAMGRALTAEDRALLDDLDGEAKVRVMHRTILGEKLTRVLALVRRLAGEQP